MRATRWFWQALGLLWAMAAVGSPALACSCMFDIEPDQYLREADLVFEGELISTEQSDGIETSATLRVLTPLKGKLGVTVTLDQSRAGMCADHFKPGEKVRIAAYGNSSEGYSTTFCTNYFLQLWDRRDELYLLALANHDRSLALAGSDRLPPNEAQLRSSLRWLAEYRALEEGLDAADKLLSLFPGDREAQLFKARFLSALDRNSEVLSISQALLAIDPADREAERLRVFSLMRLKRSAEIPNGWLDFAGLRAVNADFRGRRMNGADFSNATLHSADFSGADLSQATMLDAVFYSLCSFADADLRGAVLAKARLDGVLLSGADARGSVFAHSSVYGDLSGIDLRQADLRGTYFGEGTNWSGAKLQNADLRGAQFLGSPAAADLTGALYDVKTIFPPGFDPVAAGAILSEE